MNTKHRRHKAKSHRQTGKAPKRKKHAWIKNDYDGRPDSFAAENLGGEFHNGPKCSVCGFEFCEHCFPEGWNTECGSASLGSDDSKLDKSMVALSNAFRR